MPLVTTKEMFRKAYDGGYAIGAFNVNNMEIVQGITEACAMEKAPVILQVSKGARAYASHTYLVKLVEAALLDCPDIPIALHLDHGPDFETCKACRFSRPDASKVTESACFKIAAPGSGVTVTWVPVICVTVPWNAPPFLPQALSARASASTQSSSRAVCLL